MAVVKRSAFSNVEVFQFPGLSPVGPKGGPGIKNFPSIGLVLLDAS
jgi:hypothetical protein